MNRWTLMFALCCWVTVPICAQEEEDFANVGELLLRPSEPGRDFPNWHRSLIDGRSWIGVIATSETTAETPVGEFLVKPLKDALEVKSNHEWDWGGRYAPPARKLLDLNHDPEGVDPIYLRAVETAVTFENWPQLERRDSFSPQFLGKLPLYDRGPIIDWD